MRSRLAKSLVAVAWVAVGGASLWSINALADGVNGRRTTPRATAPVTETTPDFGQLLGGPQAEKPPEAPVAPPAPEQEAAASPTCLTFEDVLASIDRAPVAQEGQGAVQAMEGQNPDIVWCEGVREGFMLALATPAPPSQPEAPRTLERVGTGKPPGEDGGPGYIGG